MMILHTVNYHGNLHATASAINKEGLADYVLHMDYNGGSTLVVFKMPSEMVYAIRENSKSYAATPDHDFPISTPKKSDGYRAVLISTGIGSVYGQGKDAVITASFKPVYPDSWRDIDLKATLYLAPRVSE